MQTVSDFTESELIERIRRLLPTQPDWLVIGIGDDAAVVVPARNRLEVLTVDALVEGVHFDRRFTPPAAVGHRALAVNLSDLAAMGAEPRLALLSLVLPGDHAIPDFDSLVSGLAVLARRHAVHVVGGNLARSPGPLMIDVTLAGAIKPRQALTRGGARPGDEIYVSGTVGAAAAGLGMLKARSGRADLSGPPNDLQVRQLTPARRVTSIPNHACVWG
jgi:thiamine-monophosphate kinase